MYQNEGCRRLAATIIGMNVTELDHLYHRKKQLMAHPDSSRKELQSLEKRIMIVENWFYTEHFGRLNVFGLDPDVVIDRIWRFGCVPGKIK